MTIEEIKALSTADEIEARNAEIEAILDKVIEGEDVETDLDELKNEKRALSDRLAEIRESQETKKADLEAVLNGEGVECREILPKGENKMNNSIEIRNSAAYIDAFAEAIKTGDFTECRSLMTTNAPDDAGTVAIPTFIEDKIRTAWERSEIFQRVGKVSYKGNLKIGFEISGTDAVIHLEGAEAPSEEELSLGVVTLIPNNLKKWITVTDETMSLRGQTFLDYVYDEITYKIVKLAEDTVIAAIIASVGASTATMAGQATVSGDVSKATILNAIASTSDEARDLVVIMNKLTWAAFKATETLNYGDVFNGLPVVFNNSLDAYDDASDDDPFVIVGDLGYGVRINLPDGNNVKFVFDDKSLAEADLVKIVGKLYAAIGVVAPNAFCVVTKAAEDGEG